jgi:hypothetical protein
MRIMEIVESPLARRCLRFIRALNLQIMIFGFVFLFLTAVLGALGEGMMTLGKLGG